MLTRLILLLCVGTGTTALMAAAWPGPFTAPARSAETPFVPQPVALDPAIIGSGVSAAQLVQMAVDKFDSRKATWLKTKIRQSMNVPECTLAAEGFLQLGPNHCARLQLDTGTGRLTVVSDGEVAARVFETEGAAPDITIEQLPARSTDSAQRDSFLNDRGCGGPVTLLRRIQPRLDNAKLQTGLLADVPVIQVCFDAVPGENALTLPARVGYVYLDAKTLWPCRVEWWGQDSADRPHAILRIEFGEPEINRELSLAECERTFSYKPPQ